MDRAVIAKLVAPRVDRIVRRPRVFKAIDRALQARCCWVAAPAGYGKSTALADYLCSRPEPHLWYRIDESDQDVASFFHYLARLLPGANASRALPVFGPEYAHQPQAFARRFFRAWFGRLRPGSLLVLDDLHDADAAPFRAVLATLLHELPDSLRVVCLARTLPPAELGDLLLKGRVGVVDQRVLEFSEREARALLRTRLSRTASSIDVSAAHGWAIGLMLLAERGAAGHAPHEKKPLAGGTRALTGALERQVFDPLPRAEQDVLLKLSLLPEITPALAAALAGTDAARTLIERLHERQLLVTRAESARTLFCLHDLLRDFLRDRLTQQWPAEELAGLRARTANLLDEAGHRDEAIELALQARAWRFARDLIGAHAESVLAQGRRATLIEWCAKLPDAELDAWSCYWLGVAHMTDDVAAEAWLARAWTAFDEQAERRGLCLAAARAVLAKTDSWRTHEGLSVWTRRSLDLLDGELPPLHGDEEVLVLTGFARALDFAEDYRSDAPVRKLLVSRLLGRLAKPIKGDSTTLRLLASESLIEHAGSTGQIEIFEQAVDSVADAVRDRQASPWALGMWLVAFGAVSGRYFSYARRGFPYARAEDALREAVAIGESESLRGVEFGALYHLQLQMKLRNDFAEFAALVGRLAEIADSRYTTQVAVLADCQAAVHTLRGNFPEAHRACERFMAAIEEADEPPIERWPHFITKFQVLLADGKPAEAVQFLEGLLHFFDGGVLQRTQACVQVALAVQAKRNGDAGYPDQLRACMRELRATDWSSILLNLPALLAELCADALEQDIETEYCRALIHRRRLLPPQTRPQRWPWALRVHVLGDFRLECDGTSLPLGAKAPMRSLDILRVLAISKDHTCALESLHDWLWPEADGDQAKAACEQALHRLRKLLGDADLIVQREGKLRFAADRVWVDLDAWEVRLRRALAADAHGAGSDRELELAFVEFPGPLFPNQRATAWSLPAIERVRSQYLDLADRLGRRDRPGGRTSGARAVHLRALDIYPDAARLYEALIRERIAQADYSGALEDYARYERMLQTFAEHASPVIQALIKPLSDPTKRG